MPWSKKKMSTNADGTVPDKKTDDADDPTQSSPEITPPEKKKETDAKTNMKQLRKKIMKPFQSKPHGDNKSMAQPGTSEHEEGGKLANKATGNIPFRIRMKQYFCSLKPRNIGYRISGYNSGKGSPLLTDADEAKAIAIAISMFQCLTQYLAPALRDYTVANGMESYSNSSTDVYRYLKTMIKRCKNNGKCLTFGGTKGPTLDQLEKAMRGRNALCHVDLPVILADWDSFMHAWIEVSDMVNNPAAAESIRNVHDKLVNIANGNQQDNNSSSVAN